MIPFFFSQMLVYPEPSNFNVGLTSSVRAAVGSKSGLLVHAQQFRTVRLLVSRNHSARIKILRRIRSFRGVAHLRFVWPEKMDILDHPRHGSHNSWHTNSVYSSHRTSSSSPLMPYRTSSLTWQRTISDAFTWHRGSQDASENPNSSFWYQSRL